jgi:hypothetical protein|tara:strand:+ start:370 stop:480 length:111 start_codon:yes stop_codon:yes gene_type:complete
MSYKKRLHALTPCTSKEKAFLKTTKKKVKSKKLLKS